MTVAKDKGYRNLVLGAWGCGVFRNDPKVIASEFRYWLDTNAFEGAFDNVIFPVYGDKKGKITGAFKKALLY